MGKKQIQKSLRVFVKRAEKEVKAEKVILFGSVARGQTNDYSDVDVIVLSKMFAKIPQEKRLDFLYPLTAGLQPDFHPFGYTPSEFAKLSDLISISEAKKTGVVIRS
ncbi:nucleotidyltransferase domain-containing protein [Candidatus Gottesmanbacteria bacterium]|nr:nucleotidyltransferase domain-containing protein [Candidatus Gottesmanbacteria bacterium]